MKPPLTPALSPRRGEGVTLEQAWPALVEMLAFLASHLPPLLQNLCRTLLICDESQNLSPHVIKTILTRIGKGSKIVFTGDPEQIDHPYLDASSNGLSYLVERIRQEELSGHITLVRGERSGVAELGARLL